jgi:hypothetical protein
MSLAPRRPRAQTPTSGVIMEALFLAAGLVTSALGVLALRTRPEPPRAPVPPRAERPEESP